MVQILNFFKGDGYRPKSPVRITERSLTDEALRAQTDPKGYKLSGANGEAVITAVNIALVLRNPLLVSGEPGAGKTQLAYAIANELGREPPLKFVAKSTSRAQDVLYNYDAVQHFRASQNKVPGDARDFIDYAPLGLAILLALPIEVRRPFLPPAIFDTDYGEDLPAERKALLARLRNPAAVQTIVLIDEIDKAPRDFSNDLLDEVDTFSFRVPELRGQATPLPPPSMRPIVIATTNNERALPDAFLRRCIYTHLTYPAGEDLQAILVSRLSGLVAEKSAFLKDLCLLFQNIREDKSFERHPGVSELIQYIQALSALGADSRGRLADQRELACQAAPALAKGSADISRLHTFITDWSPGA